MKKIITVLATLASLASVAQTSGLSADSDIVHRIVVIGDAGDPGSIAKGKAIVIDAVRNTVPLDKKTIVLYVGDNLYVNGLPCVGDVCYLPGINAIDTQVGLIKGTEATGIFMPGNHDWANGKPQGYDNVVRQSVYINNCAENVKFYPENGCPGPEEVPLGKDAVLIIMDSEWWLLKGSKPGVESDCENKTEEEVLEQLKDIIDRNANKLVLFACHHPFKSTGVHSGYYGIKQHIFPFTDLNKNLYIPLPGLGSIYPISRGVFGSPQDMKFPLYVNMINQVEDVLKNHPYVVHIAGHEHNLQLINDSGYHYIISGGGCKSQRVGHNKKTKFAAASMGFAVVDILRNKDVKVTFYEVPSKGGQAKKAYSGNILNFSKFPDLVKDTVTKHDLKYQDSVAAPANKGYAEASGFKRMLLGDNYRREWATPVKLKVFDVNHEQGGFKIIRMGGGKQTHSLHLKDTAGTSWSLRTINKDPGKVIPKNFRHTIGEDIVQDMISANQPYGALPVPVLASALGIVHSTPKYFFVPDDYALGYYYRPVFANTVCLLEEQDPTLDGSKGKSTMKIFNKLRDKDDYKVDQKRLLKARMLDFLIADYDRHYDQWKWGKIDTGKQKIYYPIPHDRDEAFFYSDGLVMKYMTWRRLPFLKGFRYGIPQIKWEGYVAKNFDRTYLNEIDENEWKQTLQEFKNELPDSVISESVKQLPPEIARIDSSVMAKKLKSRRDLLPERSLIYYRFISKRVNILGSNKDEYFHVSRAGHDVKVTVYTRDAHEKNDTGLIMYQRQFDPHVTRELRLYGFNGNDLFKIDDDVRSGMKIRMIGGEGNDTFNIKGHVRNFIYDFKKENNQILAHNRSRNMISKDPLVNSYNDKEENYTTWRFPHFEAGYNAEDQALIGIGLMQKTFNFRKYPFSTDQKLTTLYAIANNAYQVKYKGDFREIVFRKDIVAEGEFINPTLNNFFGFGNETKKIPGTDYKYYWARFTDFDGSVMLKKRYFGNVLSIGLGPAFYLYSWNKNYNSSDRVFANPARIGLDSGIFHPKSYAGGRLSLNVNNLNAELFPTRGVDWTTDLTSMQGLNSNSNPITKFESNMAVYASLANPSNVIAVLRIGGGHIFSEHFEYFQALTLGANNYLRGFRKDRFAGSSMAYADLELRLKLLDVHSYILPGSLGVVGFNDFGRVWMRGENSHLWHDAYGGGLYFTPFNMVILSVTTALSGEETLFNFTIGAKINLTF
jgi:hypothetical protein